MTITQITHEKTRRIYPAGFQNPDKQESSP